MLLLLKLVSTRPDAPGVVKFQFVQFFIVTSGEGNGDGEALLTSGDVAVLQLGDGECDITQGDKPTTPDILRGDGLFSINNFWFCAG